ncbi:MAG: hypothetical protein DMG10_06100 [Acidobacteria bacterium]|nr:MAG: hypothetical protein DMG10_06100 [Acidobacteriota bacterium]PYV31336.1 MAG: hypothetical protein DMG09_25995 [Acidobacteriota bacterium]
MKGKKRVREELTALPNLEYWNEKVKTGWRLVAVEWERESEEPGTSVETWEEVPYGLKVAEDCTHLVENPAEREAMTLMLELLVADKPMSDMAESLNQRGFRTRQGSRWTAVAVFDLLPRLIEISPSIYPSRDWAERRKRIYRAAR